MSISISRDPAQRFVMVTSSYLSVCLQVEQDAGQAAPVPTSAAAGLSSAAGRILGWVPFKCGQPGRHLTAQRCSRLAHTVHLWTLTVISSTPAQDWWHSQSIFIFLAVMEKFFFWLIKKYFIFPPWRRVVTFFRYILWHYCIVCWRRQVGSWKLGFSELASIIVSRNFTPLLPLLLLLLCVIASNKMTYGLLPQYLDATEHYCRCSIKITRIRTLALWKWLEPGRWVLPWAKT